MTPGLKQDRMKHEGESGARCTGAAGEWRGGKWQLGDPLNLMHTLGPSQ